MSRIAQLQEVMTAQDVDLVALGPGAHMAWVAGVRPHADERPLMLCVSQTGAVCLMPVLEAESARQQTDLPFVTWSDADGPDDALQEVFAQLGTAAARSIVLDETMRADFAALVHDALPGAQRAFCGTTVGALRLCKDAEEHAALKAAALIGDAAMRETWAALRPGLTERDLAAVARDAFKARQSVPEFCIIGGGPNGAFPHHHTGDRPLQTGDVIVMDMGGRHAGYPSDMTRMAVLGTPPDLYLKVHDVVERAVQAALQAARPGVEARRVDQAARDVIADAGYGPNFVHRTGHGMGIEVHEPPYITATSETVLEPGMVFSIEPGIYLPDQFGVRLEEIVFLGDDGPHILSELPRDVKIIPA